MTGKNLVDELLAQLRRHDGHQLRCARDRNAVGECIVETVALRCEDCGESVLESVQQVRKRTRAARR